MSTQQNGRILFKGGTVVTMDRQVPNLPVGDVLLGNLREPVLAEIDELVDG